MTFDQFGSGSAITSFCVKQGDNFRALTSRKDRPKLKNERFSEKKKFRKSFRMVHDGLFTFY